MNNDLHMLSIDINNWNLINRQVVIYTWHLAVDLWRWGYGQWSTQQKEHRLQQQMNWKAQKYIDQNIVSLLKMSMTLTWGGTLPGGRVPGTPPGGVPGGVPGTPPWGGSGTLPGGVPGTPPREGPGTLPGGSGYPPPGGVRYPAGGVPCLGGYWVSPPGGVPCLGGYWVPPGVPCWGVWVPPPGTPWGVPCYPWSGYPPWGVPCRGGPGTPLPPGGTLPGGSRYPPGGYPAGGGSYLCGVQAATELFCCELALYSLMPHGIMGNVAKHHGSKKKKKKKLWDGYPPPCGETDWWMDRHVSKHYLPIVLRTRAVTTK